MDEHKKTHHQQPQQPQPPQQSTPPPPLKNPGETLGIVSIVLDVLGISLVGMILGIISRKQSKEVGASTTLGTVGMVLGIIGVALSAIALFIFFILFVIIGVAASNGDHHDSSDTKNYNDSSLYSTDKTGESKGASGGIGGSSSSSNSSLASDAKIVAQKAEAYRTIKGEFPRDHYAFDDYAQSKIPNNIFVFDTLHTSNSLTYVYCGSDSAQVSYLGKNKTDKNITPLGKASSTNFCDKK